MIKINFYILLICIYFAIYLNSAIAHRFLLGKLTTTARVRSYPNISFNKCKFECRSRKKCKAFNYRRHFGYCELLPVDSSSVRKEATPGMVYSEKKDWNQKSLSSSCDVDCGTTNVCRLNGGGTQCMTEECGSPTHLKGTTELYVNMLSIGSKVLYKLECYDSFVKKSKFIQGTCNEDGYWLLPSFTCQDLCESVYSRCLKDSDDRVMKEMYYEEGDMTIVMCANLCRNQGFRLFGLQVGQQCFCGSEATFHYQGLSTNCNDPCSGDSSTVCGGGWALSTYCVDLYLSKK